MYEIKSVDIFQTAWVMALLYAIFAEIFGLFVGFVALVDGDPGRAMFAIFLLPLICGFISFISNALLCRLYNEIAGRIGGIAFEFAPKTPESN